MQNLKPSNQLFALLGFKVFRCLIFFFYLQLMINDSILKLIDWIAKHEHDNIFSMCEYIFSLGVMFNLAMLEAWLSYIVFYFLYYGFFPIGFLLGKVEIKFNIKLKSYGRIMGKIE